MKNVMTLIATAVFLLFTASAYAHHPFSSEYDENKPVNLSGTVTKVEWGNPHVHVYMDATDPSGQTKMWNVELGSPSALSQRGWTKSTLKTQEQITVDGWQAKDGSSRANAKTVTLADGKTMDAASPHGEAANEKTSTRSHY